MSILLQYWWVIILILAFLASAGFFIYQFVKLSTAKQLAKVKEWLLYAVSQSEKVLGSKTGQLKLRFVYDMFLTKFPFLAKTIGFDIFEKLVDESLEKFKSMLATNEAVSNYVKGDE